MAQPVFIRARDVAAMLGIKTSTLRKWRHLGKGPLGFAYLGETVVVYTRESVEAFIAKLQCEASVVEEFFDETNVDDELPPPATAQKPKEL